MNDSAIGLIRQYRESHHRIAELLALGYDPVKVCRDLGVSRRRLYLLMSDPTFQELVACKIQKIDEKIEKEVDLYIRTSVANMLQAEQAVTDAIDDHFDPDGTKLPVMVLNRLSMDRADRFGYGKNQTVKVEHDFATSLDRAIARSGVKTIDAKPEPQLIEAQVVPTTPVTNATQPAAQESRKELGSPPAPSFTTIRHSPFIKPLRKSA